MFTRCPFCHKLVFSLFYPVHKRTHTKLKADGQMNEHITLAPKRRFEGSLAGVPKSYYHPSCRGATGMPEDIIRSYLANPFLYSGRTFCCGCGTYVSHADVYWVETGQALSEYFDNLRQEYLKVHGKPPPKQRV